MTTAPDTTVAARRVPIGDYGLIGDTRSGALVAPDGSIDWWCVPRFDDPPLFGRLIGGDEAGWFSLGPGEDVRLADRAYRSGTVTLVTTWSVEGGELELADSLVAEVEGRFLPGTVLVRRLTARGRAVRATLHLAPRFGYDRRVATRIDRRAGALVCELGDLAIAVTSDGPVVEAERPVDFVVSPARPVTIVLTVARRSPLIVVPPSVAADEVARDEGDWREWTAGIQVDHHRDSVVRSLMTLQLLTYFTVWRTGRGADHVAARAHRWQAQLGLPLRLAPRRIDRDRRLSRRRQAATRRAPSSPGCSTPAVLRRPHLPVLFTVDGRPGPPEVELDGWPGYADSRPVRIGNGAAGQHQLDGYGWVIDAAWLLTDSGHRLYGETWRTIAGFADHVVATWAEPDAGIWEKRAAPAHHVHSKLMAWLALDRAISIAAIRGDRRRHRRQRWITARDALASEVRDRGFDPDQNAYTGAYGAAELDAAVLVLPSLGLEPATSPRVSSAPSTPSAASSVRVARSSTDTRPAATGSTAVKGRSCRARSGSSKRWRRPAEPTRPKRCSPSSSRSAAHSACSPRRWTRRRSNTSATTRRRSPTPPSSKRCSPSATPPSSSAADTFFVRSASGRDRTGGGPQRQCGGKHAIEAPDVRAGPSTPRRPPAASPRSCGGVRPTIASPRDSERRR